MANSAEISAAFCSFVLRSSAFIFLRWIPGHHFPPIIITTLIFYLSITFLRSESFGRLNPTLREAFPAVFERKLVEIEHDGHEDVIEVVDVIYEDPIIYEDEHPFFKTLLFGIPDWREWEFSILTIAINILVAGLALDLVYRGPLLHSETDLRFSRLGFVDENSAKILVREPNPGLLPVYAYYKEQDAVDWTAASKVYYVGQETDYTYPLVISGLNPDTSYLYSLSNDLSGSFHTAPSPNSVRSQSLTFLTSSCIKANFPYRPFSHSLAIHGFEHLSKLVRLLHSTPAFMMFLGDFIYVDVPQRLASTLDHYRAEYRRVYASPSWKLRGLNGIPWLHTLDDHEIANDWAAGNETAPFPAASDPFVHYHVSVNPPLPPALSRQPAANTTYFQFTRGPASFFMLDTRRYRTHPEGSQSKAPTTKLLYGSSSPNSKNPANGEEPASMLGTDQLEALLSFLKQPEEPGVYWKFIASSVPFTKNWRFGTLDSWGGFLTERAKVLSAMHEAEAQLGVRVIVLSGDRHEFAAVRYPPAILHLEHDVPSGDESGTESTIYDHTPQAGPHEFSVGPLSMFYLPIRTFKQVDGQDVAIKYLPDGNSKVGVIEIQNLVGADVFRTSWLPSLFGGAGTRRVEGQQSLLKYSLWIDGAVAWEYTMTSPGPNFGRGRG